jgi:hypothetical protein
MSMAREQQRQLQQPSPVAVAKVVAAPQPGKGTNYTGNSRSRQYFTGIKRRFTTGTIGFDYTKQEKCCPPNLLYLHHSSHRLISHLHFPLTSHHTVAIGTDDITVKLPSNVSRWRTKHAQAWLVHTMELPQYLEAFKGASIDGMLLVNYVSESHLEEMIGT